MVDEEPADMHIPDNYIEHTLKNSKSLPPVTWTNWWKELNYLSVAILTMSTEPFHHDIWSADHKVSLGNRSVRYLLLFLHRPRFVS